MITCSRWWPKLLLLPVIYLATGNLLVVHAQTQSSRYSKLETVAANANANDAASISALADEIFPTDYWPNEILSSREAIKARLIRAEMGFYNGQHRGISCEDVSKALNNAVQQLALPRFAKTSRAQIGSLRMSELMNAPRFMHPRISDSKMGSRALGVMSPMQAAFLATRMVEQKLFNEEYQFDPGEWVAMRRAQSRALWESRRQSRDRGLEASGARVVLRVPGSKEAEMTRASSQAVASLAQNQIDSLLKKVFDDMGVQQ